MVEDTPAEGQPPQRPKVSVARIRFSGGEEYTFEPDEKIIIVGPNNSGKSELLREISLVLGWHPSQVRFGSNKVVRELKLRKDGSHDDLMAFLLEFGEENQPEHIDSKTNACIFRIYPTSRNSFWAP